ncbi:MAG: nitroreductase family protein [Treponemataceae bacterium]|nr:nitroreductase family protein [Treponemataceae bacterium]
MDFTKVVKDRYSCKKYSDRQLSKEQLTEILEAGRVAPTAKNLQPQKIYVLQKPEDLAIIDKVTPCRYGAPTVLVVAYTMTDCYTYPGGKYTSPAEDAAIVATQMMLAAYNAGVDSCWLNRFDPDQLAAELGLPEDQKILMLLDLGFGAEGAGPLANHESRKPLEETVIYR